MLTATCFELLTHFSLVSTINGAPISHEQADLVGHAAEAAHAVPLWLTLVFCGLLLGLIVCLALEEKLHARKSVIAGVFAAISLLVATFTSLPLPFGPVLVGGHAINLPVYIPMIDWGVIIIILGSSLFVDVTSKCGLFTWIALTLTKASRGDPLKLLWAYGLLTVVFSAVLNNVTAMIIVGSLSGVSLGRLQRRDLLLGFLLTEGLLTNIGGLLTLISSVPNIIVGAAAGIDYITFFLNSVGYVVVVTIITILMSAKLFGIKRLRNEKEQAKAMELVDGFDENEGVSSPGFFRFGAVMLGLFIVTIALTSTLPGIAELGMGFVALFFALVMLLQYKHEVNIYYKAVDWDLLGFFIFLFVTINVMEHAQVLALIGQGLSHVIALGDVTGSGLVLVAAAGFSSVTDNIPLAAMLANILGQLDTPSDSTLWWSIIFGANLGGNLTPIGSASTLVAVTLMHKYDLPMGFGRFVIKALPFAVVQIVLAVVYVLWWL